MKTLIVSHDAGGAYSLASYVLNNPGEYLFELEGPAIQIFKSQILNIRSYEKDDLRDVELVLTGTSSESMLEIEFIARARVNGIRTISLLDHWVNYVERFTREGSVFLPDEIWVTDEIAHKIAKVRTRLAHRVDSRLRKLLHQFRVLPHNIVHPGHG